MDFEAEVQGTCITVLTAGFSSKGAITSCDSLFAHLHGYESGEEVVGQRITDLIPSVQLPPPGEPVPEVGAPSASTIRPQALPWSAPCLPGETEGGGQRCGELGALGTPTMNVAHIST